MPVSPGAELLDMVASALATSSSVMGEKGRQGKGGGSSGCEGAMGVGTDGKNRSARTVWISDVVVPKSPDDLIRGGMWLMWRPWRQHVAVQRRSVVVWSRKSAVQECLASLMV